MSLTDCEISGPIPSPSISVTVYLPWMCDECISATAASDSLPDRLRGVYLRSSYIGALLPVEFGDLFICGDGVAADMGLQLANGEPLGPTTPCSKRPAASTIANTDRCSDARPRRLGHPTSTEGAWPLPGCNATGLHRIVTHFTRVTSDDCGGGEIPSMNTSKESSIAADIAVVETLSGPMRSEEKERVHRGGRDK